MIWGSFIGMRFNLLNRSKRLRVSHLFMQQSGFNFSVPWQPLYRSLYRSLCRPLYRSLCRPLYRSLSLYLYLFLFLSLYRSQYLLLLRAVQALARSLYQARLKRKRRFQSQFQFQSPSKYHF